MDDSYPNKLQVWRGGTVSFLQELTPAGAAGVWRPPGSVELAARLFAGETLHPNPANSRCAAGVEPYSLQWFLDIENQRHARHGRWIPRLLEFTKHAGERLLCVGTGLGTDWLQYARHGAVVSVCCPVSEQLALARRNFELRGLPGSFHNASPAALPVEASSIDVVCLNSLLDGVGDAGAVVGEVYRVLKPGGKVLAVTPARYDVDFWFGLCFPWQRWLQPKKAEPEPKAPRFSARRLCRLFGQFIEHRVYKRHLRRAEVPHVWRWMPPGLLQRMMGRVLVLKAFKPLSAAMNVHLAA
jgi:ubiquinone/menaquinone biosynthesis C-methylase UbiE